METLKAIGEPATYIVAIAGVIALVWAGIKYVPKSYRWLWSWAFVKRDELARLRKIDAKFLTTEAELKRLNEFCAPYLEQKRAELVTLTPLAREITVETEFDPREPVRNRTYKI
jgi:hypothetical protein